jgi:hypothetical protein
LLVILDAQIDVVNFRGEPPSLTLVQDVVLHRKLQFTGNFRRLEPRGKEKRERTLDYALHERFNF